MPLALVTGASTGIGRATALRLAGDGWAVLAGVRDEQAGRELELAGGGRLVALQLDITDADQVALAAGRVSEAAGASVPGGLDALVNNSGIAVGGPLEIVPAADLRRQFEVNVFAQMQITRALLPALRRAHGRLVFVSSVGGRVAMAYTAPYAASKHALEALADALRVELADSHVQVALIEPGSVATPIWDKGRSQGASIEVPPELEYLYGKVPAAMDKALADTARRGVPPERVAGTIAHALAARRMAARYVIGRDARLMIAAKRLLPAHVFDALARRALGV